MADYRPVVGLVLSMLVLLALGSTCVFYGYSCWSAESRANHTDYCKHIHNDDSAEALAAFGWIMLLPWLIGVPLAIGALFYFLWKMIQSWAVKWFGVDCSLDMIESWPFFFKLGVLSVLIFLVECLGFVCLIYGKRYCGNAELRANHTDICKGIHNDDSAKALQAFGWIFVIVAMIVGLTFLFAETKREFCIRRNET